MEVATTAGHRTAERDAAARSTRLAWLLWACVVPAYACVVARFDHVSDDAYIAFRFARNWARGSGLTWNPGVDPPIEGFSSPVWVAVMAVVEWLGRDPATVSRVISIACGLLVLRLLAHVLVERLQFSAPAALLGLAWTAWMPTFAFWSTSGLETMAFVALVFVAYQRLLARGDRPDVVGASAAGVLVFACRFDGLAWVAALLLTAWWLGRDPRCGELRRAALRVAIAVAIGCALIELARLAYFGDPLPNTARAKLALGGAQIERGLHYVARFVAVLPSSALILFLALRRWRRLDEPLRGAAALVVTTFAYAILVGGDFMLMFRFMAPAVPFLGILLARAFEDARHGARPTRVLARALAALVLVDALLPTFGIELGRRFTRNTFAADEHARGVRSQAREFEEGESVMRGWIELGKALARHTDPRASIVRGAIGAVGYHSERTVFDTYGLVDRELARASPDEVPSRARHIGGHDKYGSLAFFEPRRPTIGASMLVRRAEVETDNPRLLARLFIDPGDRALMSVYRPVLVPYPDYDGGEWYLLLAERASTPVEPERWSGPLLKPENLRAP